MKFLVLLFALVACTTTPDHPVEIGKIPTPTATPLPKLPPPPDMLPKLDWSGKNPDADKWTAWCLEDVSDSQLVKLVPNDFKKYPKDEAARSIFWCQLVSRMARYESNFNPATKYAESGHLQGIISRGLLQISLASGQAYNPQLKTIEQLHDPRINIQTGLRILETWVKRDGVVFGEPKRGCGRYWSVCRSTSASQAKIKSYMEKYQ